MVKRSWTVFFLLILAAPAPAQQQADRTQNALSVWMSLPQSERQLIRDNYRRYQSLPESQKAVIRGRFELFRSLPKSRQKDIVRRWQWFRSLPVVEQENLKKTLTIRPRARKNGTNGQSSGGRSNRGGGLSRGLRGSQIEHHPSHERGGHPLRPLHR